MRVTRGGRAACRLAVLVVIVGCGGCGGRAGDGERGAGADTGPDGDSAGRALRLAVIPKATGGEFWETVEAGAREEAAELGVQMQWEGPLTETEIAEQNKIIENMINLNVDGIALAPLNPRAMRKNVARAVEAGIPVVIFDSAVEGDRHVSFVATDNREGGVAAAQQVEKQFRAADSDLSADRRVVVLRYIQGTASTEARCEGFVDHMDALDIQPVHDTYPEDGTVAGCKKTAANVLEGFVRDGKLEVDAIFACNLVSSLGGLAAVEDLRKSGVEVATVFVGFDTSPRLIEALQEGKIDALVSQDPRNMGALAVRTLVSHLRGETVEPRINTALGVVTAEALEKSPEIRRLVGLE